MFSVLVVSVISVGMGAGFVRVERLADGRFGKEGLRDTARCTRGLDGGDGEFVFIFRRRPLYDDMGEGSSLGVCVRENLLVRF